MLTAFRERRSRFWASVVLPTPALRAEGHSRPDRESRGELLVEGAVDGAGMVPVERVEREEGPMSAALASGEVSGHRARAARCLLEELSGQAAFCAWVSRASNASRERRMPGVREARRGQSSLPPRSWERNVRARGRDRRRQRHAGDGRRDAVVAARPENGRHGAGVVGAAVTISVSARRAPWRMRVEQDDNSGDHAAEVGVRGLERVFGLSSSRLRPRHAEEPSSRRSVLAGQEGKLIGRTSASLRSAARSGACGPS